MADRMPPPFPFRIESPTPKATATTTKMASLRPSLASMNGRLSPQPFSLPLNAGSGQRFLQFLRCCNGLMELVRIGDWKSTYSPDLPEPAGLVDLSWNVEERNAVGAFLQAGALVVALMGPEECLICGSSIRGGVLTDGTYLWPGELSHYVIEHSVRLPGRFVAHVWAREAPPRSGRWLAEIEEAMWNDEVNLEWWSQVTSSLDGGGAS